MKIYSYLLFMLVIISLASCSESISSGEHQTPAAPDRTVTNSSSNTQGHILGALVLGQSCGAPSYGHLYTLYVTSNTTVGYDREVNVLIIDEQNGFPTIIEQEILTIQSNDHTSSNVAVFDSPLLSGPLGQVEIDVFSVTANGQDVTHEWDLPTQNPTVNNCYSGSNDCPDEDHDGICDNRDDDDLIGGG